MMRAATMLSACLFDCVCGDPEWLPQPVRLMGKGIDAGERLLRLEGDSAQRELAGGWVLAMSLPVVAASSSFLLVKQIRGRSLRFGWLLEALLAWTCIAAHNLLEEASAVVIALEEDDLARARKQLSRIVGRDTHMLDATEISRAVIETLAESLSDGIIAPLFYLAAGGVPAGMAYKAVNTLDSMIGHKNLRYLYFGRASARLDDLANYLPARLSTALICAAGLMLSETSGSRAYRVWLADRYKHASPNAGQPESSMAGALGVRLGGDNYYDGELVKSEYLGDSLPSPTAASARTAVRMTGLATLLGCTIAFLLLRVKHDD